MMKRVSRKASENVTWISLKVRCIKACGEDKMSSLLYREYTILLYILRNMVHVSRIRIIENV